MSEVIPAIIPKSFNDLTEHLSQVAPYSSFVQIDICDGRLTGEKSWPYVFSPDPDFTRIIKEEEGFPFWEDVAFEIDLMVLEPESVVDQWVQAGAERIIVHFESFKNKESAQAFLGDFKRKFFSPGSAVNVSIGIAINVDTPTSEVESLFSTVDFLQCMGIARIGYQGQPFDERVLEKIKDIHERYPDLIISVDGGVNFKSAPLLREVGVSRLVAGSAIFRSDNIADAIASLKNS